MTDDADPRTGTDSDLDAIDRVVATIERTQREENVEQFLELFDERAIWTTGHGTRLIGLGAIGAFTARVLPGAMADLQGTTYRVTHVEFIRPDVAAVQVAQTYADNAGVPIPEGAQGSPSYVMAKSEGRWMLVACQNTPVVSG
jgi:uncharacterized protein (TIGR02246 family)